ncbi:MAG: hypothetical protein KC589_07685 [Nanoarchaeota archaeon]|nr:hypothetical protein [Nanoarchaeota archaeon]
MGDTIANKLEDKLLSLLQKFLFMPDEKHMLQFFVHLFMWAFLSTLNAILLHKSFYWFFLTGFLIVFPFFKEIVMDKQWNNLFSPDMISDLVSYGIGFLAILFYFL